MDLRTLRLAIAYGDRSNRSMHPSQVATGDHPPLLDGKASELGGTIKVFPAMIAKRKGITL
jgi:hypothetical protein